MDLEHSALAGQQPRRESREGQLTLYVLFACVSTSMGAAIMGFDAGVFGGVSAMDGYLEKFFPEVIIAQQDAHTTTYCQYNDEKLQLVVACIFISGIAFSLPAGYFIQRFGRIPVMRVCGFIFLIGIALAAAAEDLSMLIIGRLFQGAGSAIGNTAIQIYSVEMAPAHLRGRLGYTFQAGISLGVVVAQAVNAGTQHIYPWGWRLSLALAAVPALIFTASVWVLPDTPSSLLSRGKHAEARKVLERVRGSTDVGAEYADMCRHAEVAQRQAASSWLLIFQRQYRPQLVLSALCTFFQLWTGINILTFFAVELLVALGIKPSTAQVVSIARGVVDHLSVYFAMFLADWAGRRFALIAAGSVMLAVQVAIALLLAIAGTGHWVGWACLGLVYIFSACFNMSWGAVGTLYPVGFNVRQACPEQQESASVPAVSDNAIATVGLKAEIQPLETRAAGQAVATFVQNVFNFVLGQTFLSMLCTMEWGLFIFFSCWILLATTTVILFYPETRAVPIEEVPKLFTSHWFWRRYARPLPTEKEPAGKAVSRKPGSDVEYHEVSAGSSTSTNCQ